MPSLPAYAAAETVATLILMRITIVFEVTPKKSEKVSKEIRCGNVDLDEDNITIVFEVPPKRCKKLSKNYNNCLWHAL